MTMNKEYAQVAPTRAEIDRLKGLSVLEFGTGWCGYCRAAQPLVEAAFADHPHLPHIKVEDGTGRPLGRSFKVKLWPTLIFLRDGREVARVVRPIDANEIREALSKADVDPVA